MQSKIMVSLLILEVNRKNKMHFYYIKSILMHSRFSSIPLGRESISCRAILSKPSTHRVNQYFNNGFYFDSVISTKPVYIKRYICVSVCAEGFLYLSMYCIGGKDIEQIGGNHQKIRSTEKFCTSTYLFIQMFISFVRPIFFLNFQFAC